MCVACEQSLRPDETVYLPCPKNHKYCKPCINDEWKKYERKCGKCKAHVPLEAKLEVPFSVR